MCLILECQITGVSPPSSPSFLTWKQSRSMMRSIFLIFSPLKSLLMQHALVRKLGFGHFPCRPPSRCVDRARTLAAHSDPRQSGVVRHRAVVKGRQVGFHLGA